MRNIIGYNKFSSFCGGQNKILENKKRRKKKETVVFRCKHKKLKRYS